MTEHSPISKHPITLYFSIRTATDKDSKAILDLLFNIWINEFQYDFKRKDFPDLQEIEASYNNPGGLFLVALDKGQIIGTIACQRLNATCFVLKRMFVEKTFRGRGIAQLLLNHLLDKVISLNSPQKSSFYLRTRENEAIAATKFYLKNGFQVITQEELPDNFPFFSKDDLFMKWES